MISIIIPVYRSEKTLERCIDSLKGQTCTDIEIIMVVEAPPDPSGILAGRLAGTDGRIRVVYRKNEGVSAARNAGIEAARGEYIQFVDSDDYAGPLLCERLLAAVRENGAQMALCGFHHLYYGRDVVKNPGRKGCLVLDAESAGPLLALYRGGFLNMPWNKLFLRKEIRRMFRQDMDLGEDLLFNMAYLEGCDRIAVVPEALCYYIQDGSGTTLSTKKRENRMENALYLFGQMQAFFLKKYGSKDTGGVLESRLLQEYLDEMEGLAFDGSMSLSDKMQVIRQYYGGYERIQDKEAIRLTQPDYRMIYYCFRKRQFRMALCLIELRGMAVGLARRIRRGKNSCRN